ncbi:hypothetical protein [Micromonospora sp. DT227]|uniref:hypothetical protein n=1 Tax=Micromonospora sp. DT227 TaxID=3393433 RepID=UPI003CF5DD56
MPTADGNLMAAEVAQLYALVDTLSNMREQLTVLAVSGALLPLCAFAAWYDNTAVDLAMSQVLRVVRPAQRRMAEATDPLERLAHVEFQVRVMGPMPTAAVAAFLGRLSDGR